MPKKSSTDSPISTLSSHTSQNSCKAKLKSSKIFKNILQTAEVSLDKEMEEDGNSADEEADQGGKQTAKGAAGARSQMTKAQKRKMWDRAEGGTCGERERGWDWVDIIKHLSQG